MKYENFELAERKHKEIKRLAELLNQLISPHVGAFISDASGCSILRPSDLYEDLEFREIKNAFVDDIGKTIYRRINTLKTELAEL